MSPEVLSYYVYYYSIIRCEGDLRQQKDDGGGCVKDRKEWRALAHLDDQVFMQPFLLGSCVCLDCPPSVVCGL